MHCFRKSICMMLVFFLIMQVGLLPVKAAEPETSGNEDPAFLKYEEAQIEAALPAEETEPLAEANVESEEEAQLLEETVPEETLPEETLPAETIPEESVPEETVPDASVPEETVPEESIPEETISEEEPEDAVPLYFQTDYPDTRYGSSTIAKSGCSITALAMVATYLTNHEYLPDELARYFGGHGDNNMARLEYGCEAMQLPYEKNHNWHVTRQALWDGKIAIVLMNKKSIFTESQHFVVLTGVTEDGRFLVHDPYKPNYELWNLKEGFANGFTDSQIVNGFSGAWVFDKREMPEDPFLYYEEELDRNHSRYTDVALTESEIDLIASLVWAEARGESLEGQQAVAEVVLNRLVSGNFSNTVRGIILAEGQFRSLPHLKDAQPHQAQYDAVEAALYGPNILPIEVVYFATYQMNPNVWGTIGNHIFCYPESST